MPRKSRNSTSAAISHAREQTSQEAQIELFKGWFAESAPHSQTLELFDAMPKYIFDRHAKATTEVRALRRSFSHRGVEYGLRITPAIVERDGKDLGVYPGVREELVFRAILHMAVQQHIGLRSKADKDGNLIISAAFTLSQLRKHLKKTGHEFPIAELDEAILVCRLASFDLRQNGDSARALMSCGIFMFYSGYDEDAATEEGDKSHRYVVFNPLVTKSILERTFRAINYERLMMLESPLARWLYERLSHNFRQAEKSGSISQFGYNLSLETILRESGISAEKRVRDSIDAVRKALLELRNKGVLERMKAYDEKLSHGEKPKRGFPPVVGAVWTLYPSAAVVEEIIEGNQKARTYRLG